MFCEPDEIVAVVPSAQKTVNDVQEIVALVLLEV